MTKRARAPKPSRLRTLDGLRGLAALSVLLFHYTVAFPRFFQDALPALFSFEIGAYGVHLFFVISGFVILMSLERSQGRGFIRSRFLRLYPVFWASLLLTSVVLAQSSWTDFSPSVFDAFANFGMLHDYLKAEPFDGVYWSLSYELGLYFFLYMIFRTKNERWVSWLPAYMAASTVMFSFLAPFIPHPLHLALVFNKYGYLFGCGLALFLIRQNGVKPQWLLVLVAAPLIAMIEDGVGGGLVVALIVALSSGAVLVPTRFSLLQTPVLLFLGTISYALYLTHQMIGYDLLVRLETAGWPWLAAFLVTSGVMVCIASALTFGVERPVARRFKKPRSA